MRQPPKDADENARKVTRRGLFLGGAQMAFMSALAFRMRFLQVEQADQFRLLADENRINIRLIPPARGLIFDRNGHPLAQNEQNYRIVVVREDAGDIDEALAGLARLVPLSEETIQRARKELLRRSPFVPVTVADRLTWEEVAEVAVNTPALPGITPEVGLSRFYPLGRDFAHVVGYVGPVSDYDLSRIENPDPLLQIPRFQIGKTGVEAKMEQELRGQAGSKRIEVNAMGRVIREIDRIPGRPGANIQLTVDQGLQNFMQARLGNESAAAVVLDLKDGDLLGIASAPSFDPNKFIRGISVADYQALTSNEYRPLSNKTVQGAYPPGSTFKIATALAALEHGLVAPEETVYCPGYTEVGGRRFHCWRRGGHGHVTLNESLEQSCDVYYYEIAQRVGIDRISEMARKLGLGKAYDLPLSAVTDGLTPTRQWKRANRGSDWMVGDTLNAAIGQGFVLASPLQLAVMTARVASGRSIMPRLVKSINGVEQPSGAGEPLEIGPTNLTFVRQGMHAVSNSRRGTAFRTRVVDDAMQLAGKTGTSQVRNISASERAAGVVDNDDLPWNRRDHALFICFAPYDSPRIAVSVVVEHGGGGSAVAAPIARDIALRALTGEVPPLRAYPADQRPAVETLFDGLPLRETAPTAPGLSRA